MELAKTLSPVRRPKGLVIEIVKTLAEDIRLGRLPEGSKLPTESELSERFDVSRTVVREAISRLQASQLVETRHGVGTFVNALSATDTVFRIDPEDMAVVSEVIALLELRISLESEAAYLAAQRRTKDNLGNLRAALDTFHSAIHNQSDAVPSDFQFHMEVAQATGNRHFADLMTYLGTMIIPRTRLKTAAQAPEGRLAYLQRVHGEHELIFAAIEQQNAESARTHMRLHLNNSRERLRRAQNGV